MNICIFCHQNGEQVPAKFVAPQCPTEPNGPWDYVPVCTMHADGWWDGSDYPAGHGAPAIITIPRHDPPFCEASRLANLADRIRRMREMHGYPQDLLSIETELRQIIDPPQNMLARQRIHIATVEFAMVLDDDPVDMELDSLVKGIQAAYDDGNMPDGSFRVVHVSCEQDHRDLDPQFNNGEPKIESVLANQTMTPMQALQCIREKAVMRALDGEMVMTPEDFDQFVVPFTTAPKED